MEKEILVYSYRITHFGGTAPCFDDGKFTLAICKRDMRRVIGKAMTANPNLEIWVIAINSKKLGNGFKADQINYVAKINEVVTFGEYFDSKIKRKDRIYKVCEEQTKYVSGGKSFEAIPNNGIHDEEYLHDRDWDIRKNREIKSEKYVLCSNEFKFISSEDESDCIKKIIGEDNLAKAVGHKHCEIDKKRSKKLSEIVNNDDNHGITDNLKKYQEEQGSCGKDKAI